MKVKRLHLQNYGRFEDLKIDFAPTAEKTSNVTVIVGNNGAGKSQILQALATGLSWFVNGLLSYNGESTTRTKEDSEFLKFPYEGEYIPQSRIMNSKKDAELELKFDDMSSEVKTLNISATKKGILSAASYGVDKNDFKYYIQQYIEVFKSNEKASLPLVGNYTVDRNVVVNTVSASYTFMYNQLSAYNNFINAGGSYESFFQWFRDNEDIENEKINNQFSKEQEIGEIVKLEIKLHELFAEKAKIEDIINDFENEDRISLLHKLASIEIEIDEKKQSYSNLIIRNELLKDRVVSVKLPSLNSVRNVIEHFTRFENPRIRRHGTPTMVVEKDGEELDVNQLSQGEKSLLALVGDIARRLALLNPSLDNPLEGGGVVMIDEVDLHLHPKWQHDLIDKLVATFPNVQFILTTHSPHVISDRNDILLYSLDDGELTEMPNVYGEDANTVLTKIFDVDIRDSKVEEQFNVIRRAISKHDYVTAENCITGLAEKLPSDHLELLKCRLLLAQSKLVNNNTDESSHAED